MKHERLQSLDDYYMSRPDTRPKMRWPVFDDPFFATKPLQWFDDYWSAFDAVKDNPGLYIGVPVYATEQLTECQGDPLLKHGRVM